MTNEDINLSSNGRCTLRASITVDQRGIPRPLGGRCDIGAVEDLPRVLFLPAVKR